LGLFTIEDLSLAGYAGGEKFRFVSKGLRLNLVPLSDSITGIIAYNGDGAEGSDSSEGRFPSDPSPFPPGRCHRFGAREREVLFHQRRG